MAHWPANIIFDICGVLYDESGKSLPGLMLVHHCIEQLNHEEKQRHRLFILSNIPQHTYEKLIESEPEFSTYFEQIILTHTLPYQKPDHRVFRHIIDQHDLHPAQTIFIDDSHHNASAAESIGMIGIHHESMQKTLKILKNLGVID